MIDIEKNSQMNAALTELYETYSEAYMGVYRSAFADETPPPRINEFGIVDVSRYDTDNGMLFIAKESNGWSNEEFEAGYYLREWLGRVSREGVKWHFHVKRHPLMWYNMGRWAMYLNDPSLEISYVSSCTHDAALSLGKVAFTNMNKVRGYSYSGSEYWSVASAPISGELLRAELEILQPKMIVCCGTYDVFKLHIPNHDKYIVIDMPHPGARKNVVQLLQTLSDQYKKQVSQ